MAFLVKVPYTISRKVQSWKGEIIMKKLLLGVLLFALAVPAVKAEVLVVNRQHLALELMREDFKELPQASQKLVVGFLENMQKSIKETELKQAVLPKGVEDTESIDAILPFITGVEQDYYVLASKDAQATQFVGNMLYKKEFRVKDGYFTIPNFIVKYRSYIETRTNLDDFYNDIFKDAEASKK